MAHVAGRGAGLLLGGHRLLVDRAEAFYQLALAYHQAGETEGARREVLRALELAPSFEEALELLLKLHSRSQEADSGAAPSSGGAR